LGRTTLSREETLIPPPQLNGKVVDWMEKVSDEQYNEQKR
jgi:hypothetical protein